MDIVNRINIFLADLTAPLIFFSFSYYRFCKRHQIKSSSNIPCVPKDLLMMSEFVLPRFIFCLIQYLREGYNEPGMFNPLFVSTLFKFSINKV